MGKSLKSVFYPLSIATTGASEIPEKLMEHKTKSRLPGGVTLCCLKGEL
jgi:hypothetical protein